MRGPSPTIEVQGLSKRYGGRSAVDNLSFTVPAGMVTGFLGPNGAGKSTTMRLILGLDRPDAGQATIGGTRYEDLPRPLAVVGAMLEAKAFHKGRRAYDHLLCLAQTQGLSRRRVDQVIEQVGLAEVARRRAGGFSLGMGQRLGIAAALLGDPSVLLLDEPVNGLDPDGVLWIRTLIKGLAAAGRTVLVSSHLLNEMAVTADHLIVIGRGRLIADCATTELAARVSGRSVLVRTPDTVRLSELVGRAGGRVVRDGADTLVVTGLESADIAAIAARDGVLVYELTPRQGTLEQAYMELTRDSVEYQAGTDRDATTTVNTGSEA